jgi:GTPase SAR1 family protein
MSLTVTVQRRLQRSSEMFSLVSGLCSEYFSPQQINLLVVGVQGSGKTTLLERIKVTDFPAKSVPVITSDADDKPQSKKIAGQAPENLRSKIFVSDELEDYEPPASTRARRRAKDSSPQQPPKSRFGWLCPPPPKFRQSRLDASQRSDIFTDDFYGSDHFDSHIMDDSEDETESSLVERSSPMARSRVPMKRSNSNPNILTLGSSSHHRNAVLAASAPTHGGGPLGLPAPRRISDHTSDELRKSSMETIDLESSMRSPKRQVMEQRPFLDNGREVHVEEYDIKSGAKMLPLEKIRPTIGINLAKAEICGAKVHIWDLGGKLQELWSRYYADADAVVFVWKLSRDDVLRQQQHGEFSSDDNDMEGSSRPPVTAEAQKIVLEKVRSAVADDVPFVVLGNLFRPPCYCEPDVLYSTDQLLPHYHNPHQAVFLANAASGQGVKTALEWLLTTAKRQKRIRERSFGK